MRILVTGDKGYIGTILVPMLLEKGYDVVGLDSDLFEQSTFGSFTSPITSIRKDIRDVTRADLQGFDMVLHLAALSNDPLGDFAPDTTYAINHRAAVRLAELSKEAGVERFVFSSSCSNYGAAGDIPVNEESELNPVTPYGVSKMYVERDVQKLADDHFTPVFLRNATAYGVSPRLRFDLVLNNLVAWAFTTGRVYIKSDGTPWRPIAHIEDISRAFVATVSAPREVVHNQVFNIGRTSENYRISELAEIVEQVVPNCAVEYAPGGEPDKRCYRVDCSKAENNLPGYDPQWTARKGAEELYNAYKDIGLVLDDFEGNRYKRIAHIKYLIANGQLAPDLRWAATESAPGA